MLSARPVIGAIGAFGVLSYACIRAPRGIRRTAGMTLAVASFVIFIGTGIFFS